MVDSSVLRMCGATDVHGGQHDEDVCLKECNENFEACQEEQHEERQDSDGNQNFVLCLEKSFREQGKSHEQDVTSEHVGEKSHRQAEWTHNERGDEFNWRHQDVQRFRHSWWK